MSRNQAWKAGLLLAIAGACYVSAESDIDVYVFSKEGMISCWRGSEFLGDGWGALGGLRATGEPEIRSLHVWFDAGLRKEERDVLREEIQSRTGSAVLRESWFSSDESLSALDKNVTKDKLTERRVATVGELLFRDKDVINSGKSTLELRITCEGALLPELIGVLKRANPNRVRILGMGPQTGCDWITNMWDKLEAAGLRVDEGWIPVGGWRNNDEGEKRGRKAPVPLGHKYEILGEDGLDNIVIRKRNEREIEEP